MNGIGRTERRAARTLAHGVRTTGLLTAAALLAVSGCTASAPVGSASSAPEASTVTTPSVTSASPSRTASPSPTRTASATSCASVAAKLPLDQRVGQLYMMAISQTSPGSQTSLVGTAKVGSVLLLARPANGARSTRVLTKAIAAQAADPDVPILIAADQEGGLVQRLSGTGFTRIPSATTQAGWSPAKLESAWAGYGREMRAAGVAYDLAPVADVVASSNPASNAPIGALHRQYGATAAKAGPSIAAVIRGLTKAKVASSAKHFPGLGSVKVNTDFGVAVDTTTDANSDSIASFRAAMKAGVSSVMVSSAKYQKLDPGVPAMFSKKITTDLLRTKLGFDGVIISDDLGNAKAVASVPAAQRGTTFLVAGGDLVINANPASVRAMVANTIAKAKSDPDFGKAVTAKAGRVLAMKASVGQLSCEASD